MKIQNIIEVIELFDFNYQLVELTDTISYLDITVGYCNDCDKITKIVYFNTKTNDIIPHYKEITKIKSQIEELQKQLKKLYNT